MTKGEDIAILVVAAGSGVRAGAGLPKQYRPLFGKPVLAHTLAQMRAALPDASIQIVANPDHGELLGPILHGLHAMPVVAGGATRQESVRKGLAALAGDHPHIVLIHDAARPFISAHVVKGLVERLENDPALDGVAPGIAVIDSLKSCDAEGHVTGSTARDGLWRIQTPQVFRFDAINAAHQQHGASEGLTDDFAVAEKAGLSLALLPGEDSNIKITTEADFVRGEAILLNRHGDVRTGQGFDVHAFAEGDHVMLCGVKVPHDQGLAGHSDADVGLHALTDAVLGAIGAGDIGTHFPPTDPQWRGVSSDRFLKHAADLVSAQDGIIAHVDVTLICERPRIGPHRLAMVKRISDILGLNETRVSVKATTTEGLGFTGRREGIAAMATATIRLPLS